MVRTGLRPRLHAGHALGLALLLGLSAPPVARAGVPRMNSYAITAAPYRDMARFVVSYRGSGDWRTVYHSEPPNQGGNHDTNDAHDSSTQRWSLRFTHVLKVPACAANRRGADPCRGPGSLRGATGRTSAAGRIAHTHVDGLFSYLSASVSCRVSAAPARLRLRPTLGLRYAARTGTIWLTAFIPVADALAMLPGACPQQIDPIDGLLDNYFTPGFSFATGYGSVRWFTSRPIAIPVSAFHRAARIRIAVGDTATGTPPKHCAVVHPSYESCATGGSWSGLITLRART